MKKTCKECGGVRVASRQAGVRYRLSEVLRGTPRTDGETIDAVFAKEFKQHFGAESGLAVLGDFLTLGSTATASIATNTATKTIFGALGTAFSGLNLSIQKNYFGQAFQILGTAMQTGRTKLATTIDANAQGNAATYPLEKAKSDLTQYYVTGNITRRIN